MSAKRAIGIWLKKIQMAVKVSKPWLAYVLFWWLYSSLLLQERRLIWSRQVLNRPLKALLYHFVYSFNTTTYFTWEYAVWIIIITKLVCWLVICFHLNAFQLWNNHLKHRKTKLHFRIPIFLLKIWPLLGKLYAGLLWIFYHFISFCNFWQFSAILGNLLYVSSRQYPSKSNISVSLAMEFL